MALPEQQRMVDKKYEKRRKPRFAHGSGETFHDHICRDTNLARMSIMPTAQYEPPGGRGVKRGTRG